MILSLFLSSLNVSNYYIVDSMSKKSRNLVVDYPSGYSCKSTHVCYKKCCYKTMFLEVYNYHGLLLER